MDTYLPAVKIGEVVRSLGAGRIVASNNPDFSVGDIVSGFLGWQDFVAMNPKGQLNKLPPGAPLELAMSVTAYFGLIDGGRPVAGETVVVSGAAGATGSVAGQIAKIKGLPRHRHRGRGGEMPLADRRGRLRRGDRPQVGERGGAAERAVPKGDRHFLRQCRRRHPRRGAGSARDARAGGALRRDRNLQRNRTAARAEELAIPADDLDRKLTVADPTLPTFRMSPLRAASTAS